MIEFIYLLTYCKYLKAISGTITVQGKECLISELSNEMTEKMTDEEFELLWEKSISSTEKWREIIKEELHEEKRIKAEKKREEMRLEQERRIAEAKRREEERILRQREEEEQKARFMANAAVADDDEFAEDDDLC